MDWNAIAAWIALAVSILTPTVTTIANNVHQRKLKKLELKYQAGREEYEKKRAIFQQFSKIAASESWSNTASQKAEYQGICYQMFFYVPSDLWQEIRNLPAVLSASDECRDKIFSIIERLSEILGTPPQSPL